MTITLFKGTIIQSVKMTSSSVRSDPGDLSQASSGAFESASLARLSVKKDN